MYQVTGELTVPGWLASTEKLTHWLFSRAPVSAATVPVDQAAKQLPRDTLGAEHPAFLGAVKW